MTNLQMLNKKELEHEFANDFGSPYFPILGEMYLRDKDYSRAEKVCKIGLEHNPENINGYYILSKIYIYNNKLNEAEKILTILLNKNPLHINALRLIIELYQEMNKSKKYQLKYLNQLFHIFPEDQKVKDAILTLDDSYFDKKNNKKQIDKIKSIEPNINFNIQPNMATLTFVDILKQQKHYNQALHILHMIESQTSPNKKTQKIKAEIKQLLTETK